jgi:hypothetical protein
MDHHTTHRELTGGQGGLRLLQGLCHKVFVIHRRSFKVVSKKN